VSPSGEWGVSLGPVGVGFAAVGKGLGFWEQRVVPQPIHTEAIQFIVLFIDEVEDGAVGEGEALPAAAGWCLESIALPPPAHGG